MPTGAPDYSDLLLGVTAYLTKFQDLLQQKYNKPGTSLDPSDSNLNAVADYPNWLDDNVLALVKLIEDGIIGTPALPPISGQTTDATPTNLQTLATLSADGDTYKIYGDLIGIGNTDGKRVNVELSGVFYRDAGTVNVMAPFNVLTQVGLAIAGASLLINGDDIELHVTGQAGQVIDWDSKGMVVRKVN